MSLSSQAGAVALLFLTLSACRGLEPVDASAEPATPQEDASAEVDAQRSVDPVDSAAFVAEDAGASSLASEEEAPVYRYLINTLTFPEEVSPGVVRGFDLDGRVSDGTSPEDCDWEDFESPDGVAGIDNQMARLTPLFEPAGLGQAFDYLETSIEDSGFFHLFELRGVDDLVNDDEVELVYELGGGSALMDTSGNLVAEQTMCVQNDSPSLMADSARIVDGVLHAEFEALTFVFSMFERVYPFVFMKTKLQIRIDERGHLVEGLVGGTVSMSALLALVEKGAQNTGGLLEPMTALLSPLGDMPSAEGPCTALSSVFDFSAIPVYFFPPESECDPCGNDICEYFESCETCVEDCCSGCGNGQCDVYEQSQHALSVSASGFSASEVTVMVGDTLTWSNDTEGPINLICDGNLGHKTVDAQESYETIATESGSFDCRVHELPGKLQTLAIEDNHSENCQSCPGDCGECE